MEVFNNTNYLGKDRPKEGKDGATENVEDASDGKEVAGVEFSAHASTTAEFSKSRRGTRRRVSSTFI